MKYKWIYFAISGVVIIPGVISLALWGLRPSVDFIGGTVWELQLARDQGDWNEVQGQIDTLIENEGIEISGSTLNDQGVVQLRSSTITPDQKKTIQQKYQDEITTDITELRFETVGPSLGRELLIKTITGVSLAALLILAYIAWRFKEKMYGVCAVLAMLHDSIIVLGVFSLIGHFWGVEVDSLFVTAVLTILSFSVHDTIVVYDRIRESIRKYPKLTFIELINKAVGETLVRSINNSLTIIFMLSALLLLGGESIRWFVFALLVGTIAGTYSSTFTAAPLLALWSEKLKKSK
ncbi:protein translocase subunit SecF [candidate division WWE3 bacterium]|uniref:Protein-export membrane protein SecF n=1 Tax=candidate division WWE3 bacterium TaxID=2053526 RepID=A0A955LGI7_UNCKA|nr:protein translocase subunit SecF [candidate division WWE3 bacterium]